MPLSRKKNLNAISRPRKRREVRLEKGRRRGERYERFGGGGVGVKRGGKKWGYKFLMVRDGRGEEGEGVGKAGGWGREAG